MRKLLYMLLLLAALLMTACGGATPQAATPASANASPTAEAVAEASPTEEAMAEASPTEEAMAEASPTGEATAGEGSAMTGKVESVCLVTDVGKINDGTFNEFAYAGMVRAAEELGLKSTFIETQSQTDYQQNLKTCIDEDYDVVATVGFLLADATLEAATANPDTYFIGVDQFFESPPENLVGIQYREDQAGFLAGALAGMLTESNVVGGIFGIEIPPLVKFRTGFENGVGFVNGDAQVLGVYIDSFTDPARGASTAEQFLGEGADVIFGAGGATGSGGIRRAAEQGAYVIGVDQDEFYTTFGAGETPGADRLASSALKRVDLGVYNQLKGLVSGGEPWAGGGIYVLDASNGGISYAPAHMAQYPRYVLLQLEAVRQGLADGSIDTGADQVTGESTLTYDEPVMLAKPEVPEGFKVCLVTDVGKVNDGTFNEFAYNGMQAAAQDLGFETNFIETQSQTDYQKNIGTCVDEGYNAIVTVGFLIADATLEAATANPDTIFIGVDQFFESPPENLVGIQYREDQGGFLAGALGCMLTESGTVGGVYGVEIPPVVKFRNGFENGCRYVNPETSILGVYIDTFTDPAKGASTAEQFLGEGADVIFGAGGPTGSGGIRRAAEQGVFVIGVDQDEYLTTFGGGETPGADKIVTSAVKRVDLGVYDQILGLLNDTFAGGSLYILDAANGGISYAPFHDAASAIPEPVQARLEEIRAALADGSLKTGVDPVTGDLVEDEIPASVPFQQ